MPAFVPAFLWALLFGVLLPASTVLCPTGLRAGFFVSVIPRQHLAWLSQHVRAMSIMLGFLR